MAELDIQYLSRVVERARTTDEDAFAELYAATYQRQYMFSYCYLGNEESAHKALVETYLHADRHLKDLEDPRLFVSWISQINFRVCYNMGMKQRIDGISTEDVSEGDPIIQTKQILALPFSESQALFLHYDRGMTVKDIAYLMDISGAAVRQYLKSGSERLGEEGPLSLYQKKTKGQQNRAKRDRNITLKNEEAQTILDEIYEGREKAPCQVPLDVLTTYVVYRKDRYRFQKTGLIVIMLLFLILPVFFYVPEVSLESQGTDEQTEMILHVDSLFPIQDVKAFTDGKINPVSEVEKGVYKIHPSVNGEMLVEVTVWNGQKVTTSTTIDCFDTESPYLKENYVEDGKLYLLFADDQSGIDFSTLQIISETGIELTADIADTDKGEVIIEIPTESLEIYLEDRKGNLLQLSIEIR